ncbi:MAG: RHS repeat-associated core domain-containing protein, partial [Lachnospiraceae bacterium]|nr:RHS repeat-associated core domain-containing protein [Lachnospiraceae bacterium]
GQPFGYTGYRYDRTSGTYFAQAREYDAKMGRFLSRDKDKYVYVGDCDSTNMYIYCRNSPLRYIDREGTEIIIVTGGIEDNAISEYKFVETALKNINDLVDEGVPNENITWLVVQAGYNDVQMGNFQSTANNLGINFVSVTQKEEFISYINTKSVGEIMDSENLRANDKIVGMSFFCHGQSQTYTKDVGDNQLSFAYHVSDVDSSTIDFTQSDIASLDKQAFNETVTTFYSCNAGTSDKNGKSFAQEWANQTGGVSYGIRNGRTYYGAINRNCTWGFYLSKDLLQIRSLSFYPGDWLNAKLGTESADEQARREAERMENGYSEKGSLNYPCLVSLSGDLDTILNGGVFSRGWAEFKCIEE